MEIGDPGNIDIYISSGGDVDFIAWGPFTSLQAACSSNLMSNSGVDCSYSTAATETANLTNTQAGEVYVLLITNYANITTNISFSQTGGAGSTNCGIIAPPITNNGPLCEGETLELTVTSPAAGATYIWSGPNGFTSSAMNPTINNVTTANAGTYSLAITIGSETSPPVTTDVVVSPNVTPTFAAGGTYCYGATIPALPTTSTNGVTGTWSPAINNTATTTYTFTPTSGQCATTTTLTINITPLTTPAFNAVGPYCSGTSIPALPTISNNSITGTWSPAINNTTTTTYTFTPTSGQCATTTTCHV